MTTVEVFADVVCPFTHVGLRRLVAERAVRGRGDLVLMVRAWPLELVNGSPLDPAVVAEEVSALRGTVAPDLFGGFDPARFPASSLPALALAARAYARDPGTGEAVSLALREALFEQGRDLSDPGELAAVAARFVLAAGPAGDDDRAVLADWEEGRARGVVGSPHFFLDGADYFCPTLRVDHGAQGFEVEFDQAGYAAFMDRCFG